MTNSIIGLGTSLKGDFLVVGHLRIDGEFYGSITGTSHVMIGEQGKGVFEILEATSIIIGGYTKGSLKITGHAIILATGILEGNIEADSIQIEPGGNLIGRCKINREK